MVNIAEIEAAIGAAGMTLLGAFHPEPEDGTPSLEDGRTAATLLLLGNGGPAMWDRFSRDRDPDRDTLDQWSRDVIESLAEGLGARAVFPFDTPPLPFQRWGMRAGAGRPSPLGIYLHPVYGLWHGYRGAVLLAEKLDLPGQAPAPHACESCADRPCLSTCPADAFSGTGYDVPACFAHLNRPEGADCLALGCRARRACPVGREYIYQPEQAAFHMRAFFRALSASG